jgi:hypothetical protein
MRLTIRLPGALRPDADGHSAFSVDVARSPDTPCVLADLFAALRTSHPRLERRIRDERGDVRRYVNVFVDGQEHRHIGGLAAPLRDGGEIYILQSIAGG